MCKWGTEQVVRVKVVAAQSHTGEDEWKEVGVDSCIAPIVKALQEGGIDMVGSCCGHGERHGEISLADGRSLVVVPRAETGGLEFEEIAKQPYQDMVIAAGLVEGHPADTIYLSIERPKKLECSFQLLLTTDEALAVVWAVGQALWSQEIAKTPVG